ncbi:MAG: BtrH N-terminal domain-containing protein [Bacteroidetes bacterium]|nr:BtrH N-terminal domain-containing protein [Bacteroidota bacterium]MBX7128044.1 BtrH N-terminal domain-containing protein [Flavobacteriales bacterium]MCC6655905.1 BtrH N-terminal domain-containing protein [Flavobacteriales bacterium]HMU13295.1 BtrH N-terminal domain-containing protein [Flavobacteriales bacterium]HMW98009.1 BtrH N-terminal domain-containing protein [Flavobacteriales bacterium]
MSNSVVIPFEHQQSAHCETGVLSNLMRFHGMRVSEPMAFGIGSGLFYSHMPFIKLNGIPVTSYRILPGHIFKRFSRNMGVEMRRIKFRDPREAMDELDRTLDKGLPAGMLTSVFYLPYLPKAFRFHFNGHNIVVFGREGDEYLVSDPVMETPARIHRTALMRARFAKGMPDIKGRMYYPVRVPGDADTAAAAIKGLRRTARDMVNTPISMFGAKGIPYLAGKLRNYERKLGEKDARLALGNLIRMQEEIGTGGAGFRFMFAAFLQEAATLTGKPALREHALTMTRIGDAWRDFAFDAGRVCKARATADITYDTLADKLVAIGRQETALFKELARIPKA